MTPEEEAAGDGHHVELRCAFCGKLNSLDMDRAAERPRCGQCGRPFLLDRPVRIAGDDLRRLVATAGVPVLVDFHADWCGPCKVMAPVLDEVAAVRVGRALVVKLDTDTAPQLVTDMGIRGIPTLILFRGGAEASRQTGAVPRAAVDRMLDAD